MDEYELPLKLMMLNSQKADDPGINDSYNLIRALVYDDSITNHVSGKTVQNMLDMFLFMKENFSYRFSSIEEERGTSVDEALMMLPVSTRAEGERLLAEFILSWKELRDKFGTFQICNNEIPDGGPIPEIVDRSSLNLSNLIDIETLETYECYPARMVDKLLKDAEKLFTSSNVVKSLIESNEVNSSFRGVLCDNPDEF